MPDQRDADRDRQHDQLFKGTPARGEVFDSLDSITAMDEPEAAAPAPVEPPAAAPTRPAPARPSAAARPAAAPVRSQPAPAASPAAGPETRDDALGDDVLDRDDDREPAGPSGPAAAPPDRARRPVRPAARPAAVGSSTPVTTVAIDDAPPSLRRRLLTILAIVLAATGSFLVVFPFDVTADGVTARCGPPVYEVLVPSDAAFDVPENALCGSPAQHRVIVGVLLLVGFLVIALGHQWQARARLRRARRARRHRARAPAAGPPRAATDHRRDRATAEEPEPEPAADDHRVPAGPTG